MQQSFDHLQNGVVLAELGGYGDGPYCAKHGQGAALVMLGTYIVDGADDVPYPKQFVFKPGRENYAPYLHEHIAAARTGGAQVGVSVVSIDLADTVDFLKAAQDAGADYASLCAHSTMDMFLRANVSSALCRREHWPQLEKWAHAIRHAVQIPVIFKIGYRDTADTMPAVDIIAAAGVPIIHINVHNTDPQSIGLHVITQLKHACPVLIAGGGVTDLSAAQRVRHAGAQAVAIGTAAMKTPTLCQEIQKQLRTPRPPPTRTTSG